MSAAPVTIVSSAPVPSALPARVATLVYGLVGYVGAVAALVYAIGFTHNWVVPKSIDSGTAGPIVPSLLINAGLLMVIVLQHTIMARPAFKRWITRFVPRSIERSTFCVVASAAFALFYWQWEPAPQVIWQAESPVVAWALWGINLGGWFLAIVASFMLSHFDLFGVRQT